jgi:hypothetical protein
MSDLVWRYHDGGRVAAGYRGRARDCAARAIAIATGLEYAAVYRSLAEAAQLERTPLLRGRNHPRTGMRKSTIERFLKALGWRWIATHSAGARPRRRLNGLDMPAGRVIVALARHVCAVVDGVIYDTHDPSRGGRRLVYGFWVPPASNGAARVAEGETTELRPRLGRSVSGNSPAQRLQRAPLPTNRRPRRNRRSYRRGQFRVRRAVLLWFLRLLAD